MHGRTFFHNPQIACLSVDDVLQILHIFPQLLNLSIVELLRVICGLLHVEASTNIDEHVCGTLEGTRDIERRSQRDEKWFVCAST